MKLAIIGSRRLSITNIDSYIPKNVSEIVSGGAKGIDTIAVSYARQNNIPFTEFLPEYSKYGRIAPLKRNAQIAEYLDSVLAFWDGKSKGTKHTISHFKKLGKEVILVVIE